MNIFNSFNRCLRGESRQCSLLSSTWAVPISALLCYTPGVWVGGKAQRTLGSSFLTIVTLIPSWYLYFLSPCQQDVISCVGMCNCIIILYWHMVYIEELKALFIVVDLDTELYLLPSGTYKNDFCRGDSLLQARSGPSWVILLTNIIDLVKEFFCMISELKLPTSLKHQFMRKSVHNCWLLYNFRVDDYQ